MNAAGIDLKIISIAALLRLRNWYADTIERTGTDRGYERAIAEIDAELQRRREAVSVPLEGERR